MFQGMNGHAFGMGWGWILGFILVVAIVFIVARAVNSNNRMGKSSDKSALDIIKEKYARGELNKEEFEQKKEALKNP